MERWKDIKEYKGLYQVSSLGRVRSLPRNTTKGGIIKGNKSRFYQSLCLSKNGYIKSYAIHRLVAITFIKNSDNKPYVNHKDGNKFNNRVDNLEWTTPSENKIHAVKNGFTYSPRGEKHWASKLSEWQVISIRRNAYKPQKELAKEFNVSFQTISDIINRKKWKHI